MIDAFVRRSECVPYSFVPKADSYDPFVHEPGLLASAEMIGMIDPARKHIVSQCTAATLEPRQKACSRIRQQLELHRASSLSLQDGGQSSYVAANYDIADFEADDITTAQLAVDRNVEQRPIAQSAMLVEIDADAPYLLRLQCPLRLDLSPGVPNRAVSRIGIKFRRTQDHTPFGVMTNERNGSCLNTVSGEKTVVCRPNFG